MSINELYSGSNVEYYCLQGRRLAEWTKAEIMNRVETQRLYVKSPRRGCLTELCRLSYRTMKTNLTLGLKCTRISAILLSVVEFSNGSEVFSHQ